MVWVVFLLPTLALLHLAQGTTTVVELEPVTATLSSTHQPIYGAGNCIDGDTETMPGPEVAPAICHSKNDVAPWIAIDYGTRVIVERVELFNRLDGYGFRTRNVDVRVADELPTSGDQMFSGGTLLGHFAGPGTNRQHIIISGQETTGRYVIVQMDNGGHALNLQEVKAFGRALPGTSTEESTETLNTTDTTSSPLGLGETDGTIAIAVACSLLLLALLICLVLVCCRRRNTE